MRHESLIEVFIASVSLSLKTPPSESLSVSLIYQERMDSHNEQMDSHNEQMDSHNEQIDSFVLIKHKRRLATSTGV